MNDLLILTGLLIFAQYGLQPELLPLNARGRAVHASRFEQSVLIGGSRP